MVHHETATVRDVRDTYFREHGLGADGGYTARWARFRVGPFTFLMPNTTARRRALPFHDLHHIATGYDTSWVGEGEIAAWELGSGCGKYAAAWFLNFAAFFVGLLIAPRRIWRAFRNGRASRSLYSEDWDERWLDGSVAALRSQLQIGHARSTGVAGDVLLFIACAVAIPAALAAALTSAVAVWNAAW